MFGYFSPPNSNGHGTPLHTHTHTHTHTLTDGYRQTDRQNTDKLIMIHKILASLICVFRLPAYVTSAQLYNTYNFKPLVCFTLSEYSNVITQTADTEENIIPKVAAVSLVGVISFAAAGSNRQIHVKHIV